MAVNKKSLSVNDNIILTITKEAVTDDFYDTSFTEVYVPG